MKKVLLIFLFLCLVVFLSKRNKISNCAEVEPDNLTLSDLKVSGATEDYLEAYKLFLKATASDKGEYTYSKAISALKNVYQKTDSSDVKLHCLFLISFSHFLNGDVEEAYKSALEAFNLAKSYLKDNPKIVLLDKIISGIQNKELNNISDITKVMDLGEEVIGLANDLFTLQKAREEYPALLNECVKKFKNRINKVSKILSEYKDIIEEGTKNPNFKKEAVSLKEIWKTIDDISKKEEISIDEICSISFKTASISERLETLKTNLLLESLFKEVEK